MNSFTPTTGQMRMVYITEGAHLPAAKAYDHAEASAEFDRWLNRVKAEAWEECASAIEMQGTVQIPDNPYEEKE